MKHYTTRIANNKFRKGEWRMIIYVCVPCGHIYNPQIGDPDSGIAPGTAFQDIPADWVCPICFVGKDEFEPIKE